MPEQQIDSKDGDKTEEATVDSIADTSAKNTDIETDQVQANEEKSEAESVKADDSVPENEITDEFSADENIVEWPTTADNEEETPDSAENPDDEAVANLKIAELEAKSAELAAQLADTRDQLLRKAADFENFRKRMNQEKQNAIEFANQTLLLDIIPVIDDFVRAIQSAEASEELIGLPAGKALLDGITMIEKRLTGQLESKWGLKRFNSAGEPFDPNRHEAMMMEKSPDISEAVVQEDFIKGYLLKERVIRAAKVKVLMPEDAHC